eukprot:GFYU01000662.1.p1 GENE.GFYU01000662.1~~GFYU01000662.1.p1  ORF type:complete len:369 (-),score=83.62 GFYU01000662.1:262-1368(-)
MIFPFPRTQTKSIRWENIIKCQQTESLTNVRRIAETKERIVQYLATNKSTPECIEAVEEYIPYLFALDTLVKKDPSIIKSGFFSKRPEYAWKSVLSTTDQPMVSITMLPFETTYTLLTLGMLKSNLASEMLLSVKDEEEYAEKSVEAAQVLLEAAGIFEYCSKILFPTWTNLPSNRPPEVKPCVPSALSTMCMAQAEQLAIQKAVREGKTSAAAIAKLCCDVTKKFTTADEELGNLAKVDQTDISKAFWTYLRGSIPFSKAIMTKYMALDAQSKDKCGTAIAYTQLSIKLVDSSISYMESVGMPSLLVPELHNFKATVSKLVEKLTKENDMIFFQKIDNPDTLPFCDPIAILKMKEYTLPEVAFTELA